MDITFTQLATEARKHFTEQTRDNGAKFYIHDVKDDGPDAWIYEMTRDAHGDMFPDDYKYQYVVDALDLIIENEPDDADDARELEPEADAYNSELALWLGSHVDRFGYCDEWLQNNAIRSGDYCNNPTFDILAGGQHLERSEVLHSVIGSLATELETRENAGVTGDA